MEIAETPIRETFRAAYRNARLARRLRRLERCQNPRGNFKRSLVIGSLGNAALAERVAKRVDSRPVWYVCRITGKRYHWRQQATLDWGHLRSLVEQAVEDSGFTELPWNIGNLVNAGVAPNSYPRFVSLAGERQVVTQVHRFCGWLRSASSFPALRKVIERTQCHRGVASSYTLIGLWALFHRWPSPGKLERKLWAVRRRAEAILSAYQGQIPSWYSVGCAVLDERRTGKAAVRAVAMHLNGGYYNHQYKDARQDLVELHACSVPDRSDGVIARREAEPRFVKLGFEVYRIAVLIRYQYYDFQWLVRAPDGRTYHDEDGGSSPRGALKEALAAWRKQDELAAEGADLVGFLRGAEGFCPVVLRVDSVHAGNCSAGTEAWLLKHGWAHRDWIPGVWLIPHLDESLVRNVVMRLLRHHELQQEAA